MEARPGPEEGPPTAPRPPALARRARFGVARLSARIALVLWSLLLSTALAEIALRVFCRNAFSEVEDERSLTYRYDALLGWFPVPNSRTVFTATRTVSVAHNSQGFRAPEAVPTDKPGILFLGDSFVWGFDVEASERFTEKLQAKNPRWAIYNLGVSGYGTDQEYLLLQKYFDEFRPRVVFLIICGDNDNEDNSWNCRGGYYKPYYTLEAGHLKLNGVPVPKSERTFFADHPGLRRFYLLRLLVRTGYRVRSPTPKKNPAPPTGALLLDMRRFVVEKRALFAVGLQQFNPELEKFLRDYKIPSVDLTTTNATQRYARFGGHWTPEGHAFVADRIDEFLKKN